MFAELPKTLELHGFRLARAEDELSRLQADFCKGMAHPTRIRILKSLEAGEKTVNELASLVGVTQANASQHLALLRQLGLLATRRDGTSIFYSINDRRVMEACNLVRSCIEDRVKKSQMVLAAPP
jgi:ArsR family transcriptional regulator, virulence genes transcriptional regulator